MDRRKIRLTFVKTGESVLAEMLDDEAPEVCRIVWDLLPAENKTIHGLFSGAEVFILLDNPHPAPPENLTQIPLPGEILYFYDATKNVLNPPKPIAEICVVYNRGVFLRGAEGTPTTANLFARIPGDWKYEWTEFATACKRVRTEGRAVMKIERA